jgi:hypothetical protein
MGTKDTFYLDAAAHRMQQFLESTKLPGRVLTMAARSILATINRTAIPALSKPIPGKRRGSRQNGVGYSRIRI